MQIMHKLCIYFKTTPLNIILKGICRDYTGKYCLIMSIEGRDFTDIYIYSAEMIYADYRFDQK